ncbi:MAG: GNAT family N-acetyltransferase [Kiloniellales bacterium]|nr:GNAT family N-acetyltransferase [Kiloniellales bacterium]
MTDPAPPLRWATPEDAAALAELINFAGEGLPACTWERTAEPGETVWEVGRRCARREEGRFSYRNALVLEQNGAVAACLIGFPLPEAPAPIDYDALPAMFVPLQELENLVLGTWHVNVLAAYPKQRSRGHGSALLAQAEKIAAASGRRGLSIIVADANRGARRLYERRGYRETARRPMVKEAWQNPSRDWVLLVKPL